MAVLLAVDCAGHRESDEEPAPQQGSCVDTVAAPLLKRIQGSWTVGYSDYERGQKPPGPTRIGTLEISGCKYLFTPEELPESGRAELLVLARRELPIIDAPSGAIGSGSTGDHLRYAGTPLGGLVLIPADASDSPTPWSIELYERDQEGEHLFFVPTADGFHRWEMTRGEWRRRPGEYIPGSDPESPWPGSP